MRITVDPVTRIEGHLRIEAQVKEGRVSDAWSVSPMFRGIENILVGRDPRDAWLFAQRICGVCTTVNALASVRAVENALGIVIPDNARLLRNLMEATQYAHDHVVHFYHLHGPDWFDLTSALKADPAGTAALQARLSPWPQNSVEYFTSVRDRLKALVDGGQLGPFANAYWGHPAYALAPESNLLLMAHYLQALDWQRDAVRIHAVLGGKNPHPQTYLVGGMSTPLDPTSEQAVNLTTLADLRAVAGRMRAFVDQVYVPDLLHLAQAYPAWASIGRGSRNLMAYGDFPGADGKPLMPGGILRDGRLTGVEAVDQTRITEDVTRSWYTPAAPVHPSSGVTSPRYTGPTPPYDRLDTAGRYSWSKAPRYRDTVMEVGPLARMAVAHARGVPRARQLVDHALATLHWPIPALFSTLGRMVTRALETQWLVEQVPGWLDELGANISAGNLTIADDSRWLPESWPARATGVGTTEAPRGALGHWIEIADGKISRYQIVIPSTWNGSPRDARGHRGAWEEALVGTPVRDPARPVEILRVVHAFDPCMACAVHVIDADGGLVTELTVVP